MQTEFGAVQDENAALFVRAEAADVHFATETIRDDLRALSAKLAQ